MKSYWLMIRFQLQLQTSRMRVREKGKISIKRFVLAVLALLLIIFLVASIIGLEYLLMEGLRLINRPALILLMASLVVMAISLLNGFFYIMSILYHSTDTCFLSSLPISERVIFAGRLSIVLIGDCLLSLLFMMPALVLYGIESHASLIYYVVGVASILLIPFIPVTIATFLASCLTKFASLWKRKDLWMTIGIFFIMAFTFFIQSQAMQIQEFEKNGLSFIIQLVSNQQKAIEVIGRFFPPAYWSIGVLISPYQWVEWAAFIILSIGGFSLAVFVLGKRYTRLAILSEETFVNSRNKIQFKKNVYKSNSPFQALYIREWKEILKTPTYALNTISISFVLPIMFVVLYFTMTAQINTIDIRESLLTFFDIIPSKLPLGLVAMCIAALFGSISSLNPAVATAISREGKCHLIYKMIPINPRTIIFSKFLAGYSLCIINSILTFILAVSLIPTLWVELLMGYLVALVIACIACCLGLINDMINPKLDWSTETEVIKRSKNVVISMLFDFLLLIVSILVYYFLYRIIGYDTAAILLTGILVASAVASYFLMMKVCDKYYAYLE